MNNHAVGWTPDNHPDDWRELHQRWDRWHFERVAIIVAAFIFVAIAAPLL